MLAADDAAADDAAAAAVDDDAASEDGAAMDLLKLAQPCGRASSLVSVDGELQAQVISTMRSLKQLL